MPSVVNLGVRIQNIRSFIQFMQCLVSVQPDLLATALKRQSYTVTHPQETFCSGISEQKEMKY